MSRQVPASRPTHLLFHTGTGIHNGEYRHTYCGYVSFSLYSEWNLTRTAADVTCKRCKVRLKRDGKRWTFAVALRERWGFELAEAKPKKRRRAS